MGYSQLTFCCPYYESNGKRSVHCEGGRITRARLAAEARWAAIRGEDDGTDA